MQNDRLLSRRLFLRAGLTASSATLLAACAAPAAAPPAAPAAPAALPPEAAVTGPDDALKRLMEGNQRYVADKTVDPNQSPQRRAELAAGQQPFATIFSCVDSRVPPELVFDRGLGDLFVIRTAGQVIDNAVLGSLEFGAAELGIPLIMVLGHEKCGAVKATIEVVEGKAEAPAQIGTLVEGIRPAVEQAASAPEEERLAVAVEANVKLVVEKLKAAPILADLASQGKIKIVGGQYDLDSGEVKMIMS